MDGSSSCKTAVRLAGVVEWRCGVSGWDNARPAPLLWPKLLFHWSRYGERQAGGCLGGEGGGGHCQTVPVGQLGVFGCAIVDGLASAARKQQLPGILWWLAERKPSAGALSPIPQSSIHSVARDLPFPVHQEARKATLPASIGTGSLCTAPMTIIYHGYTTAPAEMAALCSCRALFGLGHPGILRTGNSGF